MTVDLSRLSHVPSSAYLLDQVKSETDTLLLGFSCGKDSLATWLFLRDHFKIIPYFFYLVPGLESDEENLVYYESFFRQSIYRLPHPFIFYNTLYSYWYQPPQNVSKFKAMPLNNWRMSDAVKVIAAKVLPEEKLYYNAQGMRAAESIYRKGFISMVGALGQGEHRFYYPIWDWDISQTMEFIKSHGVKLSHHYQYFSRQRTSLEYRDLAWMISDYPDDFEKVIAFFPLYGAELYRNNHYA